MIEIRTAPRRAAKEVGEACRSGVIERRGPNQASRGLDAGSLSFSFGSCPTLTLAIADAMLLAAPMASLTGCATYAQHVPSGLSATTILTRIIHEGTVR